MMEGRGPKAEPGGPTTSKGSKGEQGGGGGMGSGKPKPAPLLRGHWGATSVQGGLGRVSTCKQKDSNPHCSRACV